MAARGKTSTGWFFGFKLHLVVSDRGELPGLCFTCFTPGNTDDRKPVAGMTADLFGKLVGDKGYISRERFERLFARGLQLVTRIKSNMRNHLMPLFDKLLLRKRATVETIIDLLKNACRAAPGRALPPPQPPQLLHRRHRRPRRLHLPREAAFAEPPAQRTPTPRRHHDLTPYAELTWSRLRCKWPLGRGYAGSGAVGRSGL